MRVFWQLYFFVALAYKLWGTVSAARLTGVGLWVVFDVVLAATFVALFGLAFQKRIATRPVWKFVFVLALARYVLDWIATPLALSRASELTLSRLFEIEAYALPLFPLLVAVYLYAWASDPLWGSPAPEPAERSRWTAARLTLYLVAFVWLVLLPVFERNAAHFGWGFLPALASIVAVPLLALFLVGDVAITGLAIFRAPAPRGARVWTGPVPGALLLAGYAFVLYRMWV